MAPAEFRHLDGANAWPGLGTVKPFALEVTHSPYLWTADCRIFLTRVPWDSEYRDVVAWDSAAARDRWFDDQHPQPVEFDTEIHVLPDTEVRLPIPFETLSNFNYLYIEWPAPPVDHAGAGTTRYYYFLDDIRYVAPSTTSCRVALDEWTTHIHDVDMGYIQLARGHAPMAAVTVEEYLSNPLAHTRYLATADESTGAPTERIRHSVVDVINAGPHWAVLVMSCDPSQDMGQMYEPGWRTTTSSSMTTQGALGFMTFAVEPQDLDDMLAAIDATAPQAKPSIVGCFLVPKRLVTVTETVTFFGRTAYRLDGAPQLDTMLTLSRSQFGYDPRYADIAKLYTSPYAEIEVVDDSGQTSTIRVEDTTGRLQLSVAASIVMPMIGIDAHIIGIGGGDGADIAWDNFARHTMPAYGDWTRVLRHWDIPTYAILQDVTIQDDYARYWGRWAQQSAIDSSYAMQTANAAATYAMAEESAARRTARLQTAQAANRQQLETSIAADDAMAQASKARLEADRLADAMYQNALYISDLEGIALAASQSAANAALGVQSAQISSSAANLAQTQAIVDLVWSVDDAAIDTAASVSTGGVTQSNTGSSTAVAAPAFGIGQQASASLHSISDAAFSAGQAHYNAQMAALNLDGAHMAQMQTVATYAMQASKSDTARAAAAANAGAKVNIAQQNIDNGYAISHQMQRSSLATQQAADSSINAGDNALALSQAARVRDLSYMASATARAQQEQGIEAGRRAAALGTPRVIQGGSGRSTDLTRPQAVWARIVTQPDGAIAVAGDAMLRYGYRYGGEWPLDNLVPMPKFSYWEGAVRMRGDARTNAQTRRIISAIFSAGVTAWRRPEDIGCSIYDNR